MFLGLLVPDLFLMFTILGPTYLSLNHDFRGPFGMPSQEIQWSHGRIWKTWRDERGQRQEDMDEHKL